MAYYLKSKDFEGVWFYNPQKCKGNLFDQFKALLSNEEKPNWDFINLDKIKADAYPTPFEDYEIPESGAFSIFEFDKLTDVSFYVCRDGEWGAFYEDFRGYTRLGWFSSNEDADPIEPCELGRILNSYDDVQVIPTYTTVQKPLSKERLEEIKALFGLTPKPEIPQDEIEHYKQLYIPPEYRNLEYASPYHPQPQYSNYQTQPQTSQVISPIEVIGNMVYSTLMIAPSGAGKGVWISNLIRHVRKLKPRIRFLMFDGKNDPKETNYWDGVIDVLTRVNLQTDDEVHIAECVQNLLNEMQTKEEGNVLILDELNALIEKLDLGASTYPSKEGKNLCKYVAGRVRSILSSAASTGNSRNNFVWGIGQNPNIGSLGMNGGTANQLLKLAIAVPTQTNHLKQLVLNTTFTGTKKPESTIDDIKRLMSISPVDRAFYCSNTDQWYAMPELPNYSGFNRDKQSRCSNSGESVKFTQTKILAGLGSNSTQNHHQPYSAPASQPTNVVQFPQQQNGELYRAIKYANEKAPEIVPYLKPLEYQNRSDLIYLVALAAQRSPIDAAKVSQFLESRPFVKAISGFPNKNDLIRNMLIELQQLGYGECFGYGSSLKFSFKIDGRKIG